MTADRDVAQKFWKQVEKTEGCWWWRGALADKTKKSPYGRYGKMRAHRLAYELTNGEIAAHLHVLHQCDNTLCVNPAHLFLGTPKDNALDKTRKGRNNLLKGEAWHAAHDGKHGGWKVPEEKRRRGSQLVYAKLDEKKVMKIRFRWAAVTKKYGAMKAIAQDFGVSRRTIHSIVRRRTWSHVP